MADHAHAFANGFIEVVSLIVLTIDTIRVLRALTVSSYVLTKFIKTF